VAKKNPNHGNNPTGKGTTGKKYRKDYDWDSAKIYYVQGQKNDDGVHVWASLRETAQRYEINEHTLLRRAGREGWFDEQRHFYDVLVTERATLQAKQFASDGVEECVEQFKTARALRSLINNHIRKSIDQNEPLSVKHLQQLAKAGRDVQAMCNIATGITEPGKPFGRGADVRGGQLPDGAVCLDDIEEVDISIKGVNNVETYYRLNNDEKSEETKTEESEVKEDGEETTDD
jgi:hypothetical protein